EPIDYLNGPCIEGYIDMELKDGRGISWHFDVLWDSAAWTIRASLQCHAESGNDELERVPSEEICETAMLPQALIPMAEELDKLEPKKLVGNREPQVGRRPIQ